MIEKIPFGIMNDTLTRIHEMVLKDLIEKTNVHTEAKIKENERAGQK